MSSRAVGAAVARVFASDVRARPWPALASLAAMTAGVAVFVAIWCAGSAARGAFLAAVDAVAGRATHEVTRPGGVDEARFAAFATLRGVEAAQPQVEGVLEVTRVTRDGREVRRDPPSLRLLGVDPLMAKPFVRGDSDLVPTDGYKRFTTEPDAVVLPRRWCDEVGVESGDRIDVRTVGRRATLRVLGTFDAGTLGEAARDLAIVDIATAQELLDRIGVLDRVQLRLDAVGEGTVAAALAPGERLERPDARGQRVASMMDAFRVNLLALGALALVVGSLLVFNAAQFVVVRRRPLLGQLRCLGATRSAVILAVVGETLSIGVLGGLLGVAAGGALAQGLVGSIAQTVSDLYAFVQVDVAPIPLAAWFVGPLLAGAVAALAAVWPAIDAGRTAPREVGARSRTESRYRAGLPALVGCGVVCAGLAVALLLWPTRAWWPGMAAALFVLLACALWLPPLMGSLLGVLARVGDRAGLLSMPLAAGALGRSLARAGSAAAALGVALAMAIAVIVMIASFRAEVGDWVRAALTADLYVSDPHDRAGAAMGRVPDDVIAQIARHPDVRAVERRRFADVPLGARSIMIIGTELPLPESTARFRILRGDPARVWPAVRAGAVLVSEPLASHHAVGPGDTIRLPTRQGTESVEVAAVVRDFSVDRGYALMDDTAFRRRFGDPGVRNVAIYLRDPSGAQRVAADIRRDVPRDRIVTVRSNAELRARVFEVFEETFKVTRALQVIAIAIALIGIALTLGALYLERGREIATLRAVGASLRRVTGIFVAESVLLSLFPALLAVPLGGWLAWILVHVINERSFGWTLTMHWPVGAVAATVAGAVGAGAAAAVIPWWWARRDRLAAGLREA